MTNPKTSTMNLARRAFLSRAANVAAGSAVLTVAATIAGPARAIQSSPDPILEAIEAHKTAHNFAATPQPRGRLAALIEAFNAAERALGFAIDVDEAIPGSKGAARVMGGVNPAGRIMLEGRADIELPAHEWFYRSIEEIDRDRKLTLQDAKTRQERSEIQGRFSGYRAEFLRQQKKLAAPKAKRDAERKLSEAHRALSAAENKIINYRPADLAEAAALLSHAGVDKRHSCFTCDEADLRNIMRNAAETIRRAEQRT